MHSRSLSTIFLTLLIILIPISLSFQGLDLTDQGYLASSYDLFFRSPESIYPSFCFWLTFLIGGSFLKVFSFLGLYSLRLAAVLTVYLTMLPVFLVATRVLRVQTKVALLGLLFALMSYFADPFGAMNWVNYNDLTGLFFAWAIYLSLLGLQNHRAKYFLFSGAIMGASTYLRLPNIAGSSFVLILLLSAFVLKMNSRQTLNLTGQWLLGLFLGLTIGLIAIWSFGHLQYFSESIQWLSQVSQAKKSIYSTDNLLGSFAHDLFNSMEVAVYVFTISLIIAFALIHSRKLPFWLVIITSLGVGIALARFDIPLIKESFLNLIRVRWQWSYSGSFILILCLLWTPWIRVPGPQQNWYRIVGLFSIFAILLIPAGSGRTVINCRYGEWYAITILVVLFFEIKQFAWWDNVTLERIRIPAMVCFSAAFMTWTAPIVWKTVYRDKDDRTKLLYRIENDRIGPIFTTNSRKKTLEDFLKNADPYLDKKSSLFAFEYIPMIHFLTQMKPFVPTPTPDYFPVDIFERELAKAEANKPLPTIVTGKSAMNDQWPDEEPLHLDSSPLPREQRRLLEEFKKRNNYVKIWEDKYFEVFVSKKKIATSLLSH